MASKLVGLFKTLTWDDFKGTAPQNSSFAGETDTKVTILFGTSKNAQLDPVTQGLMDNVTVTVTMDNKKSWIAKDQVKEALQQFLLDHEQVHYDIAALQARDFFIELMQLKKNKYQSQLDLQNEVNTLFTTYLSPLQKLQDAYDGATHNGLPFQASTSLFTPNVKSADQTKWEGYRDKAFSDVRAGGQTAPDGTTYKKKLMDILRADSVTW